MANLTITAEGATPRQAHKEASAKIPSGHVEVADKTIEDGLPKTVWAVADTADAAFAKTQVSVDNNAFNVKQNVLETPSVQRFEVEAFDEGVARTLAASQADVLRKNAAKLIEVKLAAEGSKGFLGIGRKPNRYQAEVLLQAVVTIEYEVKAKVEITVTPLCDLQEDLKNADRREAVIRILEANKWTPGKNEFGAYYWIAKNDLQRAAEIGPAAVPALASELKSTHALLGGMLAIVLLSRHGEHRKLRPMILGYEKQYFLLRNILEGIGSYEARKALEENSNALKAYEELGVPSYEVNTIIEDMLFLMSNSPNNPVSYFDRPRKVEEFGRKLYRIGGEKLLKQVSLEIGKRDFNKVFLFVTPAWERVLASPH